MARVLYAVAVTVALAAPVHAQSSDSIERSLPRRWEIGAHIGGGPSVVTRSLGGLPNRQLLLSSVYVTRPLFVIGPFACSYVGEALPVVVATEMPKREGRWYQSPSRQSRQDSIYLVGIVGETPVFGAGILPVGLRLSVSLSSSLLVYSDASGGAVAFVRAVPNPDARSLNFVGSAGGGLRFGSSAKRHYWLGYRFVHLSNAFTAKANPGFNAHVVYLGLSLW